MKRLAAVLLLAGAAGCASDQKLVANAAASYQYSESHYEWACVAVVGPPECKAWQLELKEARKETTLTNEVQKVGKLPAIARKRLKKIAKELPR